MLVCMNIKQLSYLSPQLLPARCVTLVRSIIKQIAIRVHMIVQRRGVEPPPRHGVTHNGAVDQHTFPATPAVRDTCMEKHPIPFSVVRRCRKCRRPKGALVSLDGGEGPSGAIAHGLDCFVILIQTTFTRRIAVSARTCQEVARKMVPIDFAVDQKNPRAGVGVRDLGKDALPRVIRCKMVTDTLRINATPHVGDFKKALQLVLNHR